MPGKKQFSKSKKDMERPYTKAMGMEKRIETREIQKSRVTRWKQGEEGSLEQLPWYLLGWLNGEWSLHRECMRRKPVVFQESCLSLFYEINLISLCIAVDKCLSTTLFPTRPIKFLWRKVRCHTPQYHVYIT